MAKLYDGLYSECALALHVHLCGLCALIVFYSRGTASIPWHKCMLMLKQSDKIGR